MRNQNQPIAVEGYPFIGLFAFVTIVFGLLGWGFLTFVLFALTLFTIYFFRNPERLVPAEEGAVVAPADGKVIFVGEVEESRYFQGPAVKVSIFMNVFDVHVNRFPCDGKVIDSFYNKGMFLNASLDKAALENEQSGLLIEAVNGQRLLCVQIAGLVARRIVSYPEVGEQLRRGMRYGLIRFGSRVDLYLPVGTPVRLRVGDRTVAGETLIATLS
ncbi:phosphatidylserine decarboxylase [Geoalkalibacter ferrihydriticus]|uniref:Phosphatidylserine decarboxylase proenzyme n=2 Tax=Geoalkalibacter ferrihydriticus TaxID=392333 RepID=A0A0C2HHY8_9BACT|nr:phosphatidylserine decarboxylase family protein [Geoalkalibacter ferrihydriticus]KIH76601.1 phosphatidylserine decarboxylase [Geoalkalibacter ferrihydriticus DSM 17813]SDM03125.1 phosphatidylserine decarboxylase [Geoalkalibacter ferrihydriticus]